MSRAFVKEADDNLPSDELPERPQSPHPNYVTRRGLEQLHARVHALQAERDRLAAQDDPMARTRLFEVKRDLRYFQGRVERAILVAPSGQPQDEVHFGAEVEIEDGEGSRTVYRIVGEDEADVHAGSISWASPLGKAMIGLKVGDSFVWNRAGVARDVELVGIRYR
ncbi:MAG: transcription elongation factor GreAB [Betaproteobacteria bacterium]|nr:MAG: transcription elongation factor GreAB [Betaproteobacteria bacterium]